MPQVSKLFLWILLIATIAVAGLWLYGGKQKNFSTALEIDAAPEVVFTFLTQPEHLKQWVSGLSEVGVLEANPDAKLGNPERKTTNRFVTLNGQSTRFEDEVLRFEQDRVLSVRSSNHSIVMTSIFQLEPREDQTRLSYRVNMLNCGIGRFLAPLRDDSNIQAQIDQDIRQLKELIEKTDTTEDQSQNAEG